MNAFSQIYRNFRNARYLYRVAASMFHKLYPLTNP